MQFDIMYQTDFFACFFLSFSLFYSQIGCRLLHLILHYFLLSNYAWMLCEGFYLHTVLVSAFVSEKRLVRWLLIVGWCSPAIVLIIYGFLRHFYGSIADTIQ